MTSDQAEQTNNAPRKTIKKRVREFDVVVSDRVRLVDAANEFIGHIIRKQMLPALSPEFARVDIPLSENEQKTFDSALNFLQRQFENGYSSTEPHEKRVEIEETLEF